MAFTKIVGAGIQTTTDVTVRNVQAGIITATKFIGDISEATGAAAGLGTALSQVQSSPLNKIYFTNQVLSIGSTITVDPPDSSNIAYTQYAEIAVEQGYDLIVEDGDDLVPDILGLSTVTATPLSGAGGRVRADQFTNKAGTGAPTFPNGVQVTGVSTLGNTVVGGGTTQLIVTGNARITGILTIGTSSITLDGSNNQVNVGTGVTINSSGVTVTGVITATSFSGAVTGNATGLSGTPNITVGTIGATSLVVSGITTVAAGSVSAPSITPTGDSNTGIFFPSADTIAFGEGGVEAVRIDSSGRVGISTNTYPNGEMLVVDSVNGNSAYNSKFVFSGTTNTSYCASTWTHGQSGTAVGYAGVGGSNTGNPSFRNTFVVGTQNSNALVLNTNDAERVRIDSSGRVTMPYQPIFMAYGNTSQNLNTSASPVKIEFTATEDIDNGSYFDAPNSNFNVPVTGKYLVYASVMLSSNFTNYDYLFMDFGKNNSRLGREIMMPRPGGGGHVSAQGSVIISAAAGDTIQVYLVQSAGTAAGVRDAFRHFYGFLIG